ncbi:MAG TPA: hypothetical protein PKC96_07540 [Bacilli bacterium]|nr:hypothetical protein [Bacilli bacterium]
MDQKSKIFFILLTIIGAAILIGTTLVYYSLFKKEQRKINEGFFDKEINERSIAKRKKSKKTFIFEVSFFILLATSLGLAIFSKFTNEYFIFGNNSVLVVGSDSMSKTSVANAEIGYITPEMEKEQFSKGDFIKIKRKPQAEEMTIYNIYLYKNEKGMVIIHRLYNISGDFENQNYVFRGDANESSDLPNVYYEQIIGEYAGVFVPKIGHFALFLQSNFGSLYVFLLLSLLSISTFFDNANNALYKKRQKYIEANNEQPK